FNKGEFDGYLLYVEGQPAGWCQAGRRDRLVKLVNQYQLQANPEVWAITCFVIRPEYRKQGCATCLLEVILEDLKRLNVKQVQAFPKRAGYLTPGEHWKGPIEMYLSVGFKVERDDLHHPVLTITL
ncbi:MAG TPA: GNAT family N-acetyltransferase, partial [candidate division Zixibacteria bacterium]|nr:GNAT family N-acetyltransferase [candidate division Zixibacteria bacterium]